VPDQVKSIICNFLTSGQSDAQPRCQKLQITA